MNKPILLRLRSQIVRDALEAEARRRGLSHVQPIIEEWLTTFVLGQVGGLDPLPNSSNGDSDLDSMWNIAE